MKHLMILSTGGVVLTLAAAFAMAELRAAEQDKPEREPNAADSPEARERDPAPESARGQGERRPRDGAQGDRGPRDRGPRGGAQGERGPQDRGPGRGFDPWRFPLMAALDVDRDGRLSAKEIENAAVALKKLDKNEDGTLTPDELRPKFGGPGGPDGPGGIGGPGRGGPGFGGPRPDRDRPGRPEAGGRPQGQDMVERLMRMDANGDGKVTKEEMPERLQRLLERMDANGDGAVDKEEGQKAAERFGRGDRPRGGRAAGGDRPRQPQQPEE
jgi:Ca2+-binding EF-hand superfamily protein